MRAKQQVYILLEFYQGDTKIIDVYAEREYAERKHFKELIKNAKLGANRKNCTYGIIKKSVKGVTMLTYEDILKSCWPKKKSP